MKKYITRLIVLFFIILLLSLGYNWIYQKVRYRENTKFTEEKFTDVPEKIEICNFGSSHGVYGLDYSDLSEKYTTFNFALISQSLSYDYRIMKQYEDNLADNGIAFILVSNFSFGSDEEAQDDFLSKNERYYTFLEPQYIKQFDYKCLLKKKYFNVLYQEPIEVLVDFLNAGKTVEDTYQSGGEEFDYEEDAEEAFDRHYLVDKNGNLIIRQEEV